MAVQSQKRPEIFEVSGVFALFELRASPQFRVRAFRAEGGVARVSVST